MTDFKGEKLVSDIKTKKVYDYIDTEKKIKQISREVYKNKDLIVHYPRGFDGVQNIQQLKLFHTLDLKGNYLLCLQIKRIMVEISTKPMYPFSDYIDANFKFEEVIIERAEKLNLTWHTTNFILMKLL
ncbi:MAG: hypothetical protein R2772_05240 [Chitinophagales bacterium]